VATGAQDTAETIVARLVETDEVDDVLGRFEPAWWYVVGVQQPEHRQNPSDIFYYAGVSWSRDKNDAFSWFNRREAEAALVTARAKDKAGAFQEIRLEPEYGKDAYADIKFNESVDDDIEAAIEKVKPLAYVVACDSKEVPGHTYYLSELSKFTVYPKDARMFANQDMAFKAMIYAAQCNGYPTSSPRWMGRMYVTSYFGESLDDVSDTLDRFQPDAWVLKAVAKLRNMPYWYSGLGRWSMEDPHDPDITLYRTAEDARAAKAKVDANYSVLSWATDAGITVEPYYRQPYTEALLEAHYKNSTTQINIPENIAGHMLEWGKLNIPEEDLYFDEKGGCGREKEPHITVKYGVPMPTPSEELRAIVHSFRPFSIQLGGVSLFENDLFDVVKLDVISEQLHELNGQISAAFPVESKFKDYIPHATIAYVKKGKGRALLTRDIFKDASDIPSAFIVQDIEFRGSGESDDPNRVVDLLPLQVAKQLGESDEVDDVLNRMDVTPEKFVVAANIKGYGQNVFYLQNDATWSYDFGSLHQGRSDNIRHFATQEEADIWINRYKRRQSKKAPGYVVKAWAIPLGKKVKLGDEVADTLDRMPEPDYVFQFDGDAEGGEPGPFYFAQTDRAGDNFYGDWVKEINDATLYSHEDVQAIIRTFSQTHPERAQYFRSVLVLSESLEADDLLGRVNGTRYYLWFAKGPLYLKDQDSYSWSATKEYATQFDRAKAEELLKFWHDSYPDEPELFKLLPVFNVRENEEADDLLDRTIDEPGFMIIYTSVKHGASYIYREEGTRAIRFTKHKPMATAFSYKEAQRIRDRVYDEQVQYWPGNTIEVVPAVHSVRENQDVKHVPDPLFTVSAQSINDRCTYYFNANGYMSRTPTSLNRSQVRRARKAAEKVYGSGVRVKPVNESNEADDLLGRTYAEPEYFVIEVFEDITRKPWYRANGQYGGWLEDVSNPGVARFPTREAAEAAIPDILAVTSSLKPEELKIVPVGTKVKFTEGKDDPFEGVGFAPDVQAFRRRGRKLRQTKRPIL
jgi:hypothetical protein